MSRRSRTPRNQRSVRNSQRSTSNSLRSNEINLVSARSRVNPELNTYSRSSSRNDYARKRQKRNRRRKVLFGVTIGIGALMIALLAAAIGFYAYINDALKRDSSGQIIDIESIEDVTVDRDKPEDPFYMLLIGMDDRGDGEFHNTDSLILARINPMDKSAALISIPRDSRVYIDGYGYNKINAAYFLGEQEEGSSGPEFAIRAVSEMTGVGIAGFAMVDFNGFKSVVDALGGVQVNVPVDIIDDYDAGDVNVYAGDQKLDGDHALVFVRARNTLALGDYQRQTDQRIFLQALAKQVLASDPVTIANTVTKIAEMCTTNMDIAEIAQVADSMRGMDVTDIHTYMIPGRVNDTDYGASYHIVDEKATKELMDAIDSGQYPAFQGTETVGKYTESYLSGGTSGEKLQPNENLDRASYTVDVKNGYAIQGAAQNVSDKLALDGYTQGLIGNTDAPVYTETLIIYQGDEGDSRKAAADDIKALLGFGRVLPSEGRYPFDGDILVVVGKDFKS